MSIKVTFPGNLKVDAAVNGFTIHTDQPVQGGGDGTAPAPYDLFLSSLATCAGIYILSFCRSRNLPTDNISIEQDLEFDPIQHKVSKITMAINVPKDFPEKYYEALVRSANMCAVKKTLQDPPEFDVFTQVR